MLLLLCSWILILFTCISWGKLLFKPLRKKCRLQEMSLIDSFFFGLCGIGAITTLLSLFMAVHFYVLLFFIFIAVIYLFFDWLIIIEQITLGFRNLKRQNIGIQIFLILSVLAIIFLGICTPLMYDEGLYHLQTMKWLETYSVIPGLGNVHGRLAFNSNFLMLSTLFNYHPAINSPLFSLNSLGLALLSSWLILQIPKKQSVIVKALLGFIVLFCIFSFSSYLSSTSTDILANIIVFYSLLSILFRDDKTDDRRFLLFILPVFCVTLKLSSAFISLIAIWMLVEAIRKKRYKDLAVYIGLGCLITIPWLVRYVILSGYLIYPFPAIDIFSFDWKVPIESVIEEKALAFTWAVSQDLPADVILNMSFTEWVSIWVKGQSVFNLAIYFLTFLSPILLTVLGLMKKLNKTLIIIWSTAFLASIFTFMSAPDARFSSGFLVLSSFLPLLELGKSLNLSRFKINNYLNYALFLFFILSATWLNHMAYNQLMHYQPDGKSKANLILEPQSIHINKNRLNLSFNELKLDTDIVLYSPTEGNQCFDHALPCAPFANDKIELRGKSVMDGFRTKSKR